MIWSTSLFYSPQVYDHVTSDTGCIILDTVKMDAVGHIKLDQLRVNLCQPSAWELPRTNKFDL